MTMHGGTRGASPSSPRTDAPRAGRRFAGNPQGRRLGLRPLRKSALHNPFPCRPSGASLYAGEAVKERGHHHIGAVIAQVWTARPTAGATSRHVLLGVGGSRLTTVTGPRMTSTNQRGDHRWQTAHARLDATPTRQGKTVMRSNGSTHSATRRRVGSRAHAAALDRPRFGGVRGKSVIPSEKKEMLHGIYKTVVHG